MQPWKSAYSRAESLLKWPTVELHGVRVTGRETFVSSEFWHRSSSGLHGMDLINEPISAVTRLPLLLLISRIRRFELFKEHTQQTV